MSTKTSIEWTATVHADGTVTPGKTWNPVTGCTKVSAGCKNCYAETIADRFWATQYPQVPAELVRSGGTVYANISGPTRPRTFTDVMTHEDRLLEPLRWKKPARVFVNSMSDLFHEDVPDAFIDQVFAVMALCPDLTFQVLTKRPERMRDYLSAQDRQARVAGEACDMVLIDGAPPRELSIQWPLPNVWLGVSCENQEQADKRIPLLVETSAAVRFVSCEPMLGPIDLEPYLLRPFRAAPNVTPDVPRIDWVIVGGESGPQARSCDVAWIRSIVRQCKAAGVPAFVKQLGSHVIDRNDAGFEGDPGDNWTAETRYEDLTPQGWQGDPVRIRLRDRKGGDPFEWPEDLRVRQWPATDHAPTR